MSLLVGHDIVGQAKTELPVNRSFDPVGSVEKQQSEPVGEFGKRVEKPYAQPQK